MTPERLDKCMKIAKSLGIQWGHDGMHHGQGTPECPRALHHHHDDNCKLPDFYTDEAANAMVLEAMPAVELYKHHPDHEINEVGWRCRPDWGLDAAVYHTDRKAAICEAFLKLLETK